MGWTQVTLAISAQVVRGGPGKTTKWQEFPLRPQGRPWAGLNTRGGKLDPGEGQLEDGSINAIINEQDILSKRKGFVRGLDERFDGVVCGLFRYTDDCGVEYVIVADQEGIKVRQPFNIPVFLGSDSLPFDSFEDDLDTTRWQNTDDYETSLGSLILAVTAASSSPEYTEESRLMQWFKPSVVRSYYVEIQYDFNPTEPTGQIASVVIKRSGSSFLQADVILRGAVYKAVLTNVQSGSRSILASVDLGGASLATGFLRLNYAQATRTVTMTVTPSGGSTVTQAEVITELSDLNLGQNSAIGLAFQTGSVRPDGHEILQVSGGVV